MNAREHSLLSYLDAAVVVGDPEGCAVYANPAFEARFGRGGPAALGRPLAELFEGGGREAVLRAVASVCAGGASARFRVREGDVGFSAVASPIAAEGTRVGVVILLKEEVEGVERLLALLRHVQDPLDEVAGALEALAEPAHAPRGARPQGVLAEEALRALDRGRKAAEEMRTLLAGTAAPAARFDASHVLRRVAERVAHEHEGATVWVLAPPSAPPIQGDGERLAALLTRMASRRLAASRPPGRLILAVRPGAETSPRVLWLSLTEHFEGGAVPEGAPDPPEAQERAAAMGALLHVASDRALGRTTLVCLPLAAS